jgi:hypothetical protein
VVYTWKNLCSVFADEKGLNLSTALQSKDDDSLVGVNYGIACRYLHDASRTRAPRLNLEERISEGLTHNL